MTKEKKKIELTEDQLAKIAGGDSTYVIDWTECPNCHKSAECWLALPEFIYFDIRCYHCGYRE